MKKEVIFIQGAGEGAYKEDSKLAASLERELGADYRLNYPQMPNENVPDYDVWWPEIRKEITGSNKQIILVGHSIGGYILLKYLCEKNVPDNAIIGICLIAAPYPSGDENWEFEGFALPDNIDTKLPEGSRVFLYQSPDDQIVPFAYCHW